MHKGGFSIQRLTVSANNNGEEKRMGFQEKQASTNKPRPQKVAYLKKDATKRRTFSCPLQNESSNTPRNAQPLRLLEKPPSSSIPLWSNARPSCNLALSNMKTLPLFLSVFAAFLSIATTQAQTLPKFLDDWKDWATWNETKHDQLPTAYDDRNQLLPLWPSPLSLHADAQGATFSFTVTASKDDWLALPGDADAWPQDVTLANAPVPVVTREGRPQIRLMANQTAEVQGRFRWKEMPQTLVLPTFIGILTLQLNGQPVELPVWDDAGRLWLQRTSTEPADKDFLAAQLFRLLQDGSPQWLQTRIDLSVAGKSREETLGHALPEGWRLASIDSPIPVAVDESGLLKAQVRAGKWTVSLSAYRTTPAQSIGFAANVKPIAEQELIGLQVQPGFRLIEFTGIPAVDVAQTTYPTDWRSFPVHQWSTAQPFQVDEKLRGMGLMKPPGLAIIRRFWLDEDGRQLTYQDELTGSGQQIWRLDAASGHNLGAVKIGGEGQLITRNPETGASGVEVRDRNLNLQAVGRLDRTPTLPATGWKKDAESLSSTLNLPPGWRLFAVFGADWSSGDWLTTWSLFDVFMLLLFTLAIGRLWDWKTGLIALLGGLAIYQEPGAPRLSWIILLIALAAARHINHPRLQPHLARLRIAAALILAASAAPFIIQQIQQTLYPQLEPYGSVWQDNADRFDDTDNFAIPASPALPAEAEVESQGTLRKSGRADFNLNRSTILSEPESTKYKVASNLKYDTKAKIQTGPAIPQWSWRQVQFGWRGPVAASENVRLLLIPAWLGRLLCLARVVLVLALAYLLLRRVTTTLSTQSPISGPTVTASLLLALSLITNSPGAQAQIPSDELLTTLRDRLLEDRTNLPQRAEIPHAHLSVKGRQLTLTVDIHAIETVAVPLPGRLPTWSPISITENVPLLRHNGYLWALASPGTHRYTVTGLIPPGAEWQWSFLLKPRQVTIDAPGWTVTGVKPSGVPEDQVFLVEQNRATTAEAAYDRRDFNPVVIIERHLELGLVWQVRTTVRRLSPVGSAVSLSLPLLPAERLLTAGLNIEKGRLDLRLGAQQDQFTYNSELTPSPTLELKAESSDNTVESWTLSASPIWNVQTNGLAPTYEATDSTLTPVWRPWPGEAINLTISRPEAIQGATTTIHRAKHDTQLGDRQRTSTLDLTIQASLGDDFRITLPPEAEVTSLKLQNQELPVRLDNGQLVVQVRPGDQTLQIAWKTPGHLTTTSSTDPVTLPVLASNITTTLTLPDSRWLLWAKGPVRGPAVRFWGLALASVLLGFLLARAPLSPLRGHQWAFLLLGFMQLPLFLGGGVILVFFALAWRGAHGAEKLSRALFNLSQLLLLGASGIALLAMLAVVHQGLLGHPEMFVTGYGSTTRNLRWFQDHTQNGSLPSPTVLTVSIWVYRAFMLAWALWLARSVLRWIPWAAKQLLAGGIWRSRPPRPTAGPPPLPGAQL